MEQLRQQLMRTHQRDRMRQEYTHREELLSIENKHLTYPNQREASVEIRTHFENGINVVVLIAEPGVGKSGCALDLAYQMCTHSDDTKLVDTDNVHVHCGMNDKEWKEQFDRNMLPSLRKNISHRSVIKKSEQSLCTLSNGIVITDECHIASGKSMSQSKILKDAGLLNIDSLGQKNNKLCFISATPESVSHDLKKWGNGAAIVVLKHGPTYKGFQVMLDEQRIRAAPKLTTRNEVRDFLMIFETRYTGNKRFFPMRGLTDESLDYVRSVAVELGWSVIHHDSVDTIPNVDELMSSPPETHTIISIKEYWRASKRLIRTHIGGTYEKPPKKRNTSATSQGLTARHCDNYDYEGEWLNPELRPLHFCDIEAIEQYVNWFHNGCNYAASAYTSTNIKSKNGNVTSRESLVHPTNVSGLSATVVTGYQMSNVFSELSDAMEWGNRHINWDGAWNTGLQQTIWKVNPCFPDGSPGNTHIRYNGEAHLITTEEEFRRQRNFSRFGSGARCLPIKTGDTLSYTIIYKTSWLK